MTKELFDYLRSKHAPWLAEALYSGLATTFPQINYTTKLQFVDYSEVHLAEMLEPTFYVPTTFKPRKGLKAKFWRQACRLNVKWKRRGWVESIPPVSRPKTRTVYLQKVGVTDYDGNTAKIVCQYDPISDTMFIRGTGK